MKKLILAVFIISAFSSLCAGEQAEIANTAKDIVLAEVNGVIITKNDFDAEVNKLPANYKEIINANKRKFLDDLILQELLYQESLKKQLDKDADVIKSLEQLKKKVIAQKLLEKEVIGLTAVNEEDIKKYYEEHKDEFKVPEQINAAHILISVKEGADEKEDKEALAKAEDLLKKINEGGDFSLLAQENSACPSKSKGGELGYFSRGQMVPEFNEAAFKLKTGEVSGVVKTDFGYHIIKIIDRQESKQKDFAEVKDEIEQKLIREKQKSAFDNYTKNLKANAKITVNEELLK